MDKKLFVAVIAAVVVIGAITGCVEEEVTPTPTPTPEVLPPEVTPTPTPEVKPPVEMKTSCEMCHKTDSTANLKAHTEGGLLVNGKPGCFNYEDWHGCHGIGDATVHTVHPSEKVGCVACHGKIPTVPQEGPGGTSCEMCHGMPNPLEPSEGRLVEIHLERGRDCTVCHVGEISEIHGLK